MKGLTGQEFAYAQLIDLNWTNVRILILQMRKLTLD